MNSLPVGTRVFFLDTRGQVVCGVVQSTSRGADVCGIYVLSPLYDASGFEHTGHPDGRYKQRRGTDHHRVCGRCHSKSQLKDLLELLRVSFL
ncbi:hypothetical protein ARMGADRAFT_456893 [Armillaria gallica]|uniref:Uncharacterized protein n=1 Tax=Armillaria gallica TaxID=47427 RepID=A0A2H3DGV8_ARMGA|nr:hypothetical protein ARMGADRAFT_456893 [Armillaria gallica]